MITCKAVMTGHSLLGQRACRKLGTTNITIEIDNTELQADQRERLKEMEGCKVGLVLFRELTDDLVGKITEEAIKQYRGKVGEKG